MNNNSTLLKLNGLIFLLLGALFVFVPNQVNDFLSESNPAPEVITVATGVFYNLLGLLLLWLAKQQSLSLQWTKIIAIIDLIWVIIWATLIISQFWISNTNGMTFAGLTAITVGWLGWLLWQASSNKR